MKRRGIIFIVLTIYVTMAAFCNSYKWKAQTGEKKARKDGLQIVLTEIEEK